MVKLFFFLLLSFTLHAQSGSTLILLMDDDATAVDTVGLAYTSAYIDRVEADGGEVIDSTDVNAFYKDAIENDYLDTLIVALIYTGGVKLGEGIITVWYDLSPNENDFITYYGLNPNYSAVNGVGGGTTPDFGASLTFTQPNSYYQIMMRTTAHVGGNIWGGAGYQYFGEGETPRFVMGAGTEIGADPAVIYTEDEFGLSRCIFNGASSSIQINNDAIVSGNAGAQNVSTDFLFFNTVEDTYFKCFVITDMLSATKDLALKNILNTIYPTY